MTGAATKAGAAGASVRYCRTLRVIGLLALSSPIRRIEHIDRLEHERDALSAENSDLLGFVKHLHDLNISPETNMDCRLLLDKYSASTGQEHQQISTSAGDFEPATPSWLDVPEMVRKMRATCMPDKYPDRMEQMFYALKPPENDQSSSD